MSAVLDSKAAAPPAISFFERYLTVWVALCIVVGVGIGQLLPGVSRAVGSLEVAHVNIPVGILIWIMIVPMLMKIDFGAIGQVRSHWRGIGVTLFVNWAVKPFSMALLGWIFIRHVFAGYLPAAQLDSYVAGLVLLAAAPCTAMVFVWSRLTDGDPYFTLTQIALNDLVMIFAFAPLVGLLLGISSIAVPWATLLASVGLYIVVPVILAQLWRKALLRKGPAAFASAMRAIGPWSIAALLAMLVLLFAFQGHAILDQPLVIAMLAVPILIQVVFNSSLAYWLNRRVGESHSVACPSALIGASNFFELAVAAAISIFGFESGAALATVVGVLIEVPVMLLVVRTVNRTKGWYGNGRPKPTTRVVAALGAAQTLAWASSYYLLAILANPIARDLGVRPPVVFGAFSAALVVSALLGPAAGRAIDIHGGRPVLALTSLIFAAGLGMLAIASTLVGLFGAWLLLGVAMASGLYEAAFSALARLYGMAARGPITGITLLAGFASTVGWPMTAWMESRWGWRGACLGWAALHLFVAFPLNLALPKAQPLEDAKRDPQRAETPHVGPASRRPSILLAIVFASTWFVSTAMASHLPRMLQAYGIPLASALLFAGLVGPAQVAARVMEFGLLRRFHPLLSARIAAALHPIGAILFIVVGGPAGAAFALLHGAGNGILTIAKGTLPLLVFGPTNYGARQGFLMIPARFAQAAAPLLFGLAVDRFGGGALWISAAVGVLGLAALALLRGPPSGGP